MASQSQIKAFQKTVWDYYKVNRRDMPWRKTTDPYAIVVSEIMLQQTQVSRAGEKFGSFMSTFPDFKTLAAAPTSAVITAWQSLGYNRRALNLHKLAQIIVRDFDGKLPEHQSELIKLPGIGAGTAGSIAAFAFNMPAVFIETNIRRVFIQHFFDDEAIVSDKELLSLVEVALDKENPREWYYALMDYGTYLAKTMPNPNRRSIHYTKQSKFEGSLRQLRGEILRQLAAGSTDFGSDERLPQVLADLQDEGFIVKEKRRYRLA
jgi:A/G-specific adenine glycosylase